MLVLPDRRLTIRIIPLLLLLSAKRKRIGVLPLLRTESTTRLQHCNKSIAADVADPELCRSDCQSIDDPDQLVSLLLFCRCCNQRRLIEILSSIADADADAPAVAADRSTAVVAVVADAIDPELCAD